MKDIHVTMSRVAQVIEDAKPKDAQDATALVVALVGYSVGLLARFMPIKAAVKQIVGNLDVRFGKVG